MGLTHNESSRYQQLAAMPAFRWVHKASPVAGIDRGAGKSVLAFAPGPFSKIRFIAFPQLAMKKPRSNSAEAAVAALVNVAKGPIHPPAHVRLREGDEPFWLGVVCARARGLTQYVARSDVFAALCPA